MEFQEFPKMARLTREVIVTEKIDGTNAQVFIAEDGTVGSQFERSVRPLPPACLLSNG